MWVCVVCPGLRVLSCMYVCLDASVRSLVTSPIPAAWPSYVVDIGKKTRLDPLARKKKVPISWTWHDVMLLLFLLFACLYVKP